MDIHTHADLVEAETNRVLQDAHSWMSGFIEADTEKNRVIHALLDERERFQTSMKQAEEREAEIERLQNEIERLSMNLESEMESRRCYQLKYKALETDSLQRNVASQRLEGEINEASFIQVLVDGDGAKFADHFLQDPDAGAPAAGQALIQAVRGHLEDDSDLSRLPIFCRVYANLPGLAKALRLSNVIGHDNNMALFAEHFTNSFAEFDFVSVGKGKENTDSKIRDMLSHYFNNLHCWMLTARVEQKKIFLACCHDNGYLHALRKYIQREHRDKIVLIETTPAEPDFQRLGYPIARFDGVFKTNPLANETKRMSSASLVTSRPLQPITNHVTSPAPAVSTPEQQTPQIQRFVPTPPGSSSHASPTLISVSEAGSVSRTPSVVTSGNGGVSISYATAGGAQDYQNVTVKPAKVKPAPKVIEYNFEGCRIDPPISHPSQTPAQTTYQDKLVKVQPGAFCNDHYLVGRCTRRGCERIHNVSLTPQEISIHRYKARTSVCPRGPECDDYNCYLSHHCLKDPRCTRGNNCKFTKTDYGNLHLNTDEKLKPVIKWIEGNEFPVKYE